MLVVLPVLYDAGNHGFIVTAKIYIFFNMPYDYDEKKFLGSRRSSDYVLHCIIVAISDGQCVSCVCVCSVFLCECCHSSVNKCLSLAYGSTCCTTWTFFPNIL